MLDSLRSACAEDARLSEARCSQLIHRLLCLLLLDETTESTAGGDRIAQAIRYMNRLVRADRRAGRGSSSQPESVAFLTAVQGADRLFAV